MSDISADRVTLSRQELYEQVWSTPMSRLARQYGLSDSGLAKVCKKYSIPRPPRGHWSRLRHGKEVRVKPLPAIDDERVATVVLDPHAPTPGSGQVGDVESGLKPVVTAVLTRRSGRRRGRWAWVRRP